MASLLLLTRAAVPGQSVTHVLEVRRNAFFYCQPPLHSRAAIISFPLPSYTMSVSHSHWIPVGKMVNGIPFLDADLCHVPDQAINCVPRSRVVIDRISAGARLNAAHKLRISFLTTFLWSSPRHPESRLFTALHEMQTRSSDENSVCLSVRPSVCPSVCHTRELWQNGGKICPDLYTIRKIIYPSFLRRRMVGGGATPSARNFGSTGPRWNKIADFEPIIARNASAVTPNANGKSTTRFPMSLR